MMRPGDHNKKDWLRLSPVLHHITNKEQYHYGGAYMNCIRGLDFLDSCPEVDGSRIGLWGTSQGGGMALTVASLDPRPKASISAVPWLCDFPVSSQVTAGPYREMHDHLALFPKQRLAALHTLAFFNPINLVDNITCPTLVSASVNDNVHPCNTVIPELNKMTALKSLALYRNVNNSHYMDCTSHGIPWLQRYI
jgi:cephalosporin-C deacetylase